MNKEPIKSQKKDPYQELLALLLGYDFNYSADLATHYLRSLIELKWCFGEKVVAIILKEINRQYKLGIKNSKPNSKPRIGRDFRDLCKAIRKIPKFKKSEGIILELEKIFEIIRDERNTLVHGELIFEESSLELNVLDSSKDYITPLTPFHTPKIAMRNQMNNKEDKIIPQEQDELRSIDKRFDKFLELMRELATELNMGSIQLDIKTQIHSDDPKIGIGQPGNRIATSEFRILPRDIQRLKPLEMPKSRHCRICKQNFIGDEVCKHLEMINEILTGE